MLALSNVGVNSWGDRAARRSCCGQPNDYVYGQREIVDILGIACDGQFAPREHREPKKRYKACRKGSWGRVGSLVAGSDGIRLVTMTEIVPSSPAIFVDCGVFFTPGSTRLAIPAS